MDVQIGIWKLLYFFLIQVHINITKRRKDNFACNLIAKESSISRNAADLLAIVKGACMNIYHRTVFV